MVNSLPEAAGTRAELQPAALAAEGPSALYYLHPLLAGPIGEWDRHFARIAAMGFDSVVLAPPFAAGASGDLFATADHRYLDSRIGGGEALAGLFRIAQDAAARGLAVLLDLVLDRLAAEAPLSRDHPDWFAAAIGAEQSIPFRLFPAADALLEWWGSLLAAWCEAGIAGFRCETAHHTPPHVWARLIAAVRGSHPRTRFLAFTHGATPQVVAGLVSCGFDAAASSSCWWDFRAAWLDDDAERAGAIGPVIAMPEPLFGARAAALATDPAASERASRRALLLAANYAASWLMPMGFEYGTREPLDRANGDPGAFAALAATPVIDLGAEIAACNAHRQREPRRLAASPASLVTAPGAEIAVLARNCPGLSPLVLALNPALERPASIPLAGFLPELGGAGELRAACDRGPATEIAAGQVLSLASGEAHLYSFFPAAPIRRSRSGGGRPGHALAHTRIAIIALRPCVEGGAFAVKRTAGEMVNVAADMTIDGHARLAADLLWRPADMPQWQRLAMEPLGNDRYAASFPLARIGRYEFTVEAWHDAYAGLVDDLLKKRRADLAVDLEIEEATALVRAAADRTSCAATALAKLLARLAAASTAEHSALLSATDTLALMRTIAPRDFLVRHEPALPLEADRPAAGFASWYELFPRSQSGDPGRHGSFADVIVRLPAIRAMGFDVLYFPPIHPIGRVNRKGRNNALAALPGDPGSPWAIGAAEGGHDAIHPCLGTLEDFHRLRDAAATEGIEIALDLAIQCAPDHPWISTHPEWFDWRADGSVRYAENPPKRYEDIVNVSFYAPRAVPDLWIALRDVVRFWMSQGVRTFRVDNPHTKPLPFWVWLLDDIRARDPDAIFLAEAFTRPAMMYRLAKIGFSQSYTYFTWRNTKHELQDYFTELSAPPVADFFRPHLFVNTPDINPFFLQDGGRPAFLIRAALAATLSGLWGLYSGFELCEAAALPGREEYRDSEKYQLRARDWDRPGNITAEITRLNHIRRANPALHSHRGLEFLNAFHDQVLYYAKTSRDGRNMLLIAVSLDPHHAVETEIEIPLWRFGLPDEASLAAEELMHGNHLVWHGKRQRLRLDPEHLPFAIWRLEPPVAVPP